MDAPVQTREEILAEQHRILADLYAVPGLGEHLSSVRSYRYGRAEAQLYGEPRQEGSALSVARDVFDKPIVKVHNVETNASAIHVYVEGTFRGVPIDLTSVVTDQASRDIIRDLPVDRVIDALAGDPPVGQAKLFHLGDILSITARYLAAPDGFAGVYRILNYMTGDTLVHRQLTDAADLMKPVLLNQFPQLDGVHAPNDVFASNEQIAAWLATQVAQFGEWHTVIAPPSDLWADNKPTDPPATSEPYRLVPIEPSDLEED